MESMLNTLAILILGLIYTSAEFKPCNSYGCWMFEQIETTTTQYELPTTQAIPSCALEHGKSYYLKRYNQYAVIDKSSQRAYMKSVAMASATKFVAFQRSCDSYYLCVDNLCMCRCADCFPGFIDYQSIKFHVHVNDAPAVGVCQWNLQNTTADLSGPYFLKIDNRWFLRAPLVTDGYVLSLSETATITFEFIPASY